MASDNSQINIADIIKSIKKEWKTIIITTIVFTILGLILAFTSSKQYKSEAKLVPEASKSILGGSSIGGLASMAGINMNLGGNEDAISPELYPQLITTTPFLLKLFQVKVETKDGKIKTNYADYLLNHQSSHFWQKDSVKRIRTKINQFQLTKTEENLTKFIGKSIFCSVDDNTQVISISFTDKDPLVAATMAKTVVQNLQDFIVDYRTKKARNDLAYMKKLFAESKAKYLQAQGKYASYSDANEDLILQSYKTRQTQMENEMQLRYNIYTQVAQQLQMAEAKVQEKTPVYAVLQPASVPIRPTGIGRSIIVLGFMFIGLFLSLVWVIFLKNLIKKFAND